MSLRAEFEDWASSNWINADKELRYKRDALPKSDPHYNDYVNIKLQAAWEGWQASRQALKLALPSRSDLKYMEYYADVEGGCFNRQAYIDDLVIALQAAGLRFIP